MFLIKPQETFTNWYRKSYCVKTNGFIKNINSLTLVTNEVIDN